MGSDLADRGPFLHDMSTPSQVSYEIRFFQITDHPVIWWRYPSICKTDMNGLTKLNTRCNFITVLIYLSKSYNSPMVYSQHKPQREPERCIVLDSGKLYGVSFNIHSASLIRCSMIPSLHWNHPQRFCAVFPFHWSMSDESCSCRIRALPPIFLEFFLSALSLPGWWIT